jgi:charged multivesicular body protein 2A
MGMMKSQISGAATQMKLNHTQAKMVESMAGAATAMGKMNEAVDPAKMMKMMAEFERENEKMDTKQEMMDEALDGLFDDDVIEGEADAVTEQVRPKPETRDPRP